MRDQRGPQLYIYISMLLQFIDIQSSSTAPPGWQIEHGKSTLRSKWKTQWISGVYISQHGVLMSTRARNFLWGFSLKKKHSFNAHFNVSHVSSKSGKTLLILQTSCMLNTLKEHQTKRAPCLSCSWKESFAACARPCPRALASLQKWGTRKHMKIVTYSWGVCYKARLMG